MNFLLAVAASAIMQAAPNIPDDFQPYYPTPAEVKPFYIPTGKIPADATVDDGTGVYRVPDKNAYQIFKRIDTIEKRAGDEIGKLQAATILECQMLDILERQVMSLQAQLDDLQKAAKK